MANTENTVPVLVELNNVSSIQEPVNNLRTIEQNLYNLLNGKDYKANIKSILDNTDKLNKELSQSKGLLQEIRDSLKPNALRTSTPSTSVNTTENVSQLNDDVLEVLNKISEKLDRVLSSNVSERDDTSDFNERNLLSGYNDVIRDLLSGYADNKVTQDELLNRLSSIFENIKECKCCCNRNSIVSRSDSEIILDSANEESTRSENDEKINESKSQKESADRARKIAEDIADNGDKQLEMLSAIKQIGSNFLHVFTSNFREVFNKWDTQTLVLKESGMGSHNAAQLNRYTKRTMDAAENTLGFNISIDKAIKSANDMLNAGLNPRYVRENNKEMIMGLTALGINLTPDTLRELGNIVTDKNTAKELVGEWAKLTSPDTENALSKDFLAQQLGSDEYKKMVSTIMYTSGGKYNRLDVEREMQAALRTGIEAGLTNQTAWEVAQLQTQSRLGMGAYTVLPQHLHSLIGAAQTAGTFTGDISNLADSLKAATQMFHSDINARNRMLTANASLAVGNDFTFYDNIINNDAHTRRIATAKDIEEGQYEGLIVRAAKTLAGLMPAESIGGVSQTLTGDSTFLTEQFSQLGAGLVKDIANPQVALLTVIAKNTSKVATGSSSILGGLFGGGGGANAASSSGGAFSKFLGSGGALALGLAGVATLAGVIYDKFDESNKEKEQVADLERMLIDYNSQEQNLSLQLHEARMSGNSELAEQIAAQLREVREKYNQTMDEVISREENASDSDWTAKAGIIGGVVGLATGAVLTATGVGSAVGIPLMVAAGGGLAAGGTYVATSLSDPDKDKAVLEKRQKLHGYFEGGIIDEEQEALIGEGNKPEVIIPLTNPTRAEELMSDAASLQDTHPSVVNMMTKAVSKALPTSGNESVDTDKSSQVKVGKSVADLIIDAAKSQLNIPYKNGGDAFKHPERGLVCNMLVEYAYKKAGADIKRGTVTSHWKQFNQWEFTDTPQPGYAIFSNYGPHDNMVGYQHMGIIGYNNERIHSSSAKGKVVLDDNFVKTLAYERGKKWASKGYQPYIFGKFKGLDYGTTIGDTTISSPVPITTEAITPQSNTELLASYEPTVDYSAPIADYSATDVPASIGDMSAPNDVVSLRDNDKNRLKRFLLSYDPSFESVIPDVITDALESKLYDNSNSFYDALSLNNPFNVTDIDGKLKDYSSLEHGIDAFVSILEKAFDDLSTMTYRQQIDSIRSLKGITPTEEDKVLYLNRDKLILTLEKLTKSVEESNRLASTAYRNSLPKNAYPERRYV